MKLCTKEQATGISKNFGKGEVFEAKTIEGVYIICFEAIIDYVNNNQCDVRAGLTNQLLGTHLCTSEQSRTQSFDYWTQD